MRECLAPGAYRPAPVGTHPAGASPHGVEDMIGNVSEWVSDWYTEFEPVCAQPCVDPEGISESASANRYHSRRGGSYDNVPGVGGLLLHERGGHDGRIDLGFRCALK